MSDWQPIDTIPTDRATEVETVTGIICIAKPQNTSASKSRWIKRADKWGPRRVPCFRKDIPSGDVMAIAWREPREWFKRAEGK